MELFWAKGFEGTTLEELQAAMGGINPPSFYHAFGSKEQLFKEAVELYVETVGAPPVQALEAARTAREGVGAMLRRAAETFSQPGKPQGCLLLFGASNCAPANQGVQTFLQSLRVRAPEAIEARLRRGVDEGDLPAQADIGRIAEFYVTIAHGLGVRAADGAAREDLLRTVDGAMAAWAALVAAPAPEDPGRGRDQTSPPRPTRGRTKGAKT